MTVPSNSVSANGVGSLTDDEINSMVQVSTTVAHARTFVGRQNMTLILLGTSATGDGGQGCFTYNATSTAADDNGATVIRPNGVAVGAWIRIGTFT